VHHNEGNTTLLRTLVSIVRKSPLKYIKEIILVDDMSEDRPYLGKPLDDFAKKLPVKVVVLRNTDRMGLMRSRLRGAEIAKGDTLTFLDAHVEVTNGWLPPLLYEIKKNRFAALLNKISTCPCQAKRTQRLTFDDISILILS
jgi:polypeptide N-acetylgalactosaminyltransferase